MSKVRVLHAADRAFTLAEVLIVVGIIALLISILLPMAARAREAGRQAACLNNLRQVAAGIMSYVNDNDGSLPFSASAQGSGQYPSPNAADWIWWHGLPGQPGYIGQIGAHGIGPYLHLPTDPPGMTGTVTPNLASLSVLHCPSDDASFRPKAAGAAPYPFSYVINSLTASGQQITIQGNLHPAVRALHQIKDGASKILVYEEDSSLIDDGNGQLFPDSALSGSAAGSWNGAEFLSLRHDWTYRNLADTTNGNSSSGNLTASYSTVPPNAGGGGNAAFCDGHGEFVQRGFAHSKDHYAPDPVLFGPNVP